MLNINSLLDSQEQEIWNLPNMTHVFSRKSSGSSSKSWRSGHEELAPPSIVDFGEPPAPEQTQFTEYQLVIQWDSRRKNIHCPFCLKNTQLTSLQPSKLLAFREIGREYSVHEFCLNNSGLILSALPLHHIASITPPFQMPKFSQPLGKRFLMEVRVSHPVLNTPFAVFTRRMAVFNSIMGKIALHQFQGAAPFQPSAIAFSLYDLRFQILVWNKNKQIYNDTFLVELLEAQEGEVEVTYQSIRLRFEVCRSPPRIQAHLQNMNFKYAFPSGEQQLTLLKRVCYLEKLVSRSTEFSHSSTPDSKDSLCNSQAAIQIQVDTRSLRSSKSEQEMYHESMEEPPQGIEDYEGKVLSLCRTNQGSRVLQTLLSRCSQKQFQMIFNEVKDHMANLVRDQYANYMVQILFHYCQVEHRLTILSQIGNKLPSTVLNKKATHCLQTLLSLLSAPSQFELLVAQLEDEGALLQACNNNNGTHFIQKVFLHVPLHFLERITATILNNVASLANNTYGVCVLKTLSKRLVNEGLGARRVIASVAKHFQELVFDQFSFYFVQYLLEIGDSQSCQLLFQFIRKDLVRYCQNRTSLIVVEKAAALHAQFCRGLSFQLLQNEYLLQQLVSLRTGSLIQRLKNCNARLEERVRGSRPQQRGGRGNAGRPWKGGRKH